jgi:hypothetical protein
MAKKSSITVNGLLPLGAPKLATILIELSEKDKEIKKRLERLLSLMGSEKTYVTLIRKQIKALANSKKMCRDDAQVDKFLLELHGLRQSIAGDLGATNPVLAEELLREFVGVADTAIRATFDGEPIVVFVQALFDWATMLAAMPKVNLEQFMQQLHDMIMKDRHAFTIYVIPYLEKAGVFKQAEWKKIQKFFAEKAKALPALPEPKKEVEERQTIMLGENADPHIAALMIAKMGLSFDDINIIDTRGRQLMKDQHAYDRQRYSHTLCEIADVLDDVDAYIDAVAIDQKQTSLALEVVERLLKHLRAKEALTWLEKVPEYRKESNRTYTVLLAKALQQDGQVAKAQTIRWNAFESTMNEMFYVDYVDHAPKADLAKAREKAVSAAMECKQAFQAMLFLVWAHEYDALKKLVLLHRTKLKTEYRKELHKVAEFLVEGGENEVAALIYRALLQQTLGASTSSHYKHAAKELEQAELCARRFREDQKILISHDDFMKEIKQKHGKKYSFWEQVKQLNNNKRIAA